MTNRGHILVAGPAGPALDDTALILDQRGFATTVAPDAVTLGDLRADAVVLVGDPDADAAVGLTSTVCTERPGLPVVLVLAADRDELLDAATRAGAFAVLTAPIDHQSMVLAVDRAIEHRALRREVRRLERVVRRRAGFDGLLGSSPQMQSLFRPARTRRRLGRLGAVHGRERHGKGGGGARLAPPEPALRRALRPGQRRGGPRRAAGG